MADEIAFDDGGDPLLDQFSADGFVDCTFRIAEISSNAKDHSLLLAASHQGIRVGFRAVRMADITPLTGIALHQDDVDMETQAIRIKLFGCDSDEEVERDEYFESFFNLDLQSGLVFWNEKDPDYRSPLIRGLSVGKL
jgi:hypothetical protein